MKKEIPLEHGKICRKCGCRLGYYEETKGHKIFERKYFSIKPKSLNGSGFYRTLCIDCFEEEHNRLPMSPNTFNRDCVVLLEIPQEIFEGWSKAKAVTLENMIRRHGLEEGARKFASYKEKQAESNSFEYKHKKHGWTQEQYDNFNLSRAVTRDNLTKKHGKQVGDEIFERYRERQRYAGCSEDYFINKLGEDEGRIKYISLNKQKARPLEQYILKYGEDEGRIKYIEDRTRNSNPSTYFSKESQQLFWDIYNQLEPTLRGLCYFGELNKEFNRYSDTYKRVFFYDFVIKDKIVIEFNGEHVHPRLDHLTEEEAGRWRQCFTGKTARDVIDIDEHKRDNMVDLGYEYIIVWRGDWIDNKAEILYNITNKINQGVIK